MPPPGVEPGHVTHPSTNRARRRVTSLIRPTPLPLATYSHTLLLFFSCSVSDFGFHAELLFYGLLAQTVFHQNQVVLHTVAATVNLQAAPIVMTSVQKLTPALFFLPHDFDF